jgi:hypothetical protein
MVTETGAVYEAKFMLLWSFSEGAAAEKYMAQLRHNMWVTNAKTAALSIVTGGGKWVEIPIAADPLYQHLLLTAEKKFWRCVQSGDRPHLFGVAPPKPRIEGVSHDSFSRRFRLLDPEEMATAFTGFVGALRQGLGLDPAKGVVAVDGKRLRRSYERGRACMPPLMISVWDAETRLSLATRHAPGGNDVAATLAALKSLVLKGCIIAYPVGCQSNGSVIMGQDGSPRLTP